MSLFLQHILITVASTTFTAVVGFLLNRKLTVIKLQVNGKMSKMERDINALKKRGGK